MRDDDDDDDVTSGAYLEHLWSDDGRLDTGESRTRCTRCGTAQHWPAGRASCVVVLAHVAMIDFDPQPLREGQWPGPYSTDPHRVCQNCDEPYKRPISHGATKSCSPQCSHEVKLATNRRLRDEARARKQRA